jgi:tuberculosinol/isotuberculosinol synthase
MISLIEFLELPTPAVAALVRQTGPQVCVFPINGTRRWFMLEHAQDAGPDPIQAYMDISSRNHISLYKLFFDHGIDTLLTPAIGPDILLRGDEYMQRIGAAGMERLASGKDLLEFYAEYDVRVHFYGNYRKAQQSTPHAYLTDLFDQIVEQTKYHTSHRLFFGIFGNDATDAVAEWSIQYHQKHNAIPSRREIVEMYYGEYVEPVTMFIGFDKFSAFDYPLLSTGEEDLYFMVAPSPYLSTKQLKEILYDHIYTRKMEEPDYQNLDSHDQHYLKDFYYANRENTQGIGKLLGKLWLPQSRIVDPGIL